MSTNNNRLNIQYRRKRVNKSVNIILPQTPINQHDRAIFTSASVVRPPLQLNAIHIAFMY